MQNRQTVEISIQVGVWKGVWEVKNSGLTGISRSPTASRNGVLGQTSDQPGLAGLETARKRETPCWYHIRHSRRQTFLRPSCPDSGILTYQCSSAFQATTPCVWQPSCLALDPGVPPKTVSTASASLWSGRWKHSLSFSPCPEEQQQGNGNAIGWPLIVKAVKSREMQDFSENTELVQVEGEKGRRPVRNWRQFSRIHHQAV